MNDAVLKILTEPITKFPECNYIVIFTSDIIGLSDEEILRNEIDITLIVSLYMNRLVMCTLAQPDKEHQDGEVFYYESENVPNYKVKRRKNA